MAVLGQKNEFSVEWHTTGSVISLAPFVSPFIKSISLPEGDFVFGGLVGEQIFSSRPRAEMLQQFLSRTNIVAYDWELTGPKIKSLLFVGQTFRLLLHKPQLPFDSPSLLWLKSMSSKLGNSGTVVVLSSPSQLSFTRVSGIGFTATELHLLADWLESPAFPRGFHTSKATPPPLFRYPAVPESTLPQRQP